ncbi:uncharacterized protein MELLADRAFT_62734 [Melampsora larici-populina 98AG31]|uniref:Uncharacterized protein n=1 Tax=Melampsora larici-populina (strain 98AG31 / pathotype 3-4-7) TaxID=747676 RepID=F4RK11_MELLP|nr:uncharacterized protein MELLADRAFT_62734 [Melampsora larici-populina 98AG31]EGG07020.1 hypothetical protein MELLADRAFT_62734 [Melampsora larici-populina 98AG31]
MYYTLPTPPPGVFQDKNKLIDHINSNSLQHGYKISILGQTRQVQIDFKCSKGKTRQPWSKGTCPFKLVAKQPTKKDLWTLTVVEPRHDHPASTLELKIRSKPNFKSEEFVEDEEEVAYLNFVSEWSEDLSWSGNSFSLPLNLSTHLKEEYTGLFRRMRKLDDVTQDYLLQAFKKALSTTELIVKNKKKRKRNSADQTFNKPVKVPHIDIESLAKTNNLTTELKNIPGADTSTKAADFPGINLNDENEHQTLAEMNNLTNKFLTIPGSEALNKANSESPSGHLTPTTKAEYNQMFSGSGGNLNTTQYESQPDVDLNKSMKSCDSPMPDITMLLDRQLSKSKTIDPSLLAQSSVKQSTFNASQYEKNEDLTPQVEITHTIQHKLKQTEENKDEQTISETPGSDSFPKDDSNTLQNHLTRCPSSKNALRSNTNGVNHLVCSRSASPPTSGLSSPETSKGRTDKDVSIVTKQKEDNNLAHHSSSLSDKPLNRSSLANTSRKILRSNVSQGLKNPKITKVSTLSLRSSSRLHQEEETTQKNRLVPSTRRLTRATSGSNRPAEAPHSLPSASCISHKAKPICESVTIQPVTSRIVDVKNDKDLNSSGSSSSELSSASDESDEESDSEIPDDDSTSEKSEDVADTGNFDTVHHVRMLSCQFFFMLANALPTYLIPGFQIH